MLDKNKFSLGAAIIIGIIYVVCAVVVALWPDLALRLLGWVAHIVNVGKFAGDVRLTLAGFIAGLVQILVYSYISGWLFAWLFNRSVEKD